jgi:nucleoside-diphosphate-sugar epimerase
LNRDLGEDEDVIAADCADYHELYPHVTGQDAVVPLEAHPYTDGTWPQIRQANLNDTQIVLEAALDAEIESVVFASTHHVVGMYEVENASAIYDPGFDPTIDETVPHRPDSIYGASKGFNEDMGRYYVENERYPARFYVVRMNAVRDEQYDHPYGDGEAGADRGD